MYHYRSFISYLLYFSRTKVGDSKIASYTDILKEQTNTNKRIKPGQALPPVCLGTYWKSKIKFSVRFSSRAIFIFLYRYFIIMFDGVGRAFSIHTISDSNLPLECRTEYITEINEGRVTKLLARKWGHTV